MTNHRIPLTEIAEKLADGAHSIFSASGSAMWLTCPGSLIPNALAPDSGSEAAAEGTVAHAMAEEWLKSGKRPSHRVGHVEKVIEGDVVYEITVDEVMLDYVQVYVDWCIYQPGVHLVERRVDYSNLTPIGKQGGTADHIALQPGVLTITDLKFGIGIPVYAERNSQLMLYAYGAFREYDELYDFQRIVIRVAQPRLDHLDEWECSRDELLEFAERAKAGAHAAWCHGAERVPSAKGCQWCKVKADCSAFAVFTERLTDGVFDDLNKPITQREMDSIKSDLDDAGQRVIVPVDPAKLTVEQKARLLGYKELVVGWFNRIEDELYQRLQSGLSVPGYKLVEGRSRRDFGDPNAALLHLQFLGLTEDEVQPRVMISPSKAEEALVKLGYRRKQLPTLMAGLIDRTVGNPTMAPETDKRAALSGRDDGAFENLETL